MNQQRLSGAISLLGLLAMSSPAFAQTVDVQQYWTSASESKAMNAIADAFKAHGGKWIDSPSADFDSTIAAATSRIAGGEPPSAVLMTPSAAMRDLASSGQLRNLDDLAAANGWQKAMVPIVWNKLTVDGHLVGLPVGIHADNWVWYSKSAFEKAGIEEPKTLDDMFAAADKLKASGSIPFAVGGEPWQEVYVLTSMIISLGGPEYWNDLFVKRDPEALKSPILPKAFELFRKVGTYTDPASAGRSWNETTNLVTTGKAGMQFMGDWARGEFLAAGQTAGKEFGCFLVPTEKPAYAVVVDIFAFPVNKDEDRVKGQTLLAETVMDPAVEAKIAAVKGSVPSRLDVDTSTLDMCAVKGVKALATPGVAVSSTYDALPGDLNGQMTDLATQFWTDPSMSVETAVKGLADILQSK
ncbi:ABC transporter substrate-binding protein [Mesorhizobium sp. BH1-1-5]|uniref:ABC transporter substrate-binding protein n=1 Tax=unclassified Mesorhizobium TaxID=325217 RepID=UPI001128BE91|nr:MULTISPECIES: ABC transporter substrate-binding protein [unclassified Mesorhizobium]MBZ9988572.1 ABC transporter substrate-binding protein [Mesorhizobium sp. BH1-1-5]TPJ72522.1 carbohydrate ABC transporter substrate-binding protein [Mesorhizobium sp. B2-7-1]